MVVTVGDAPGALRVVGSNAEGERDFVVEAGQTYRVEMVGVRSCSLPITRYCVVNLALVKPPPKLPLSPDDSFAGRTRLDGESLAMSGNTTSAMFLLKCRHGYREGDQSELANRVSINFQLPGALPLEQFARVIEHESDRAEPLPAKALDAARRT